MSVHRRADGCPGEGGGWAYYLMTHPFFKLSANTWDCLRYEWPIWPIRCVGLPVSTVNIERGFSKVKKEWARFNAENLGTYLCIYYNQIKTSDLMTSGICFLILIFMFMFITYSQHIFSCLFCSGNKKDKGKTQILRHWVE